MSGVRTGHQAQELLEETYGHSHRLEKPSVSIVSLPLCSQRQSQISHEGLTFSFLYICTKAFFKAYAVFILSQYSEVHYLLQELHLDDDRFQWYFCLSMTQFEDLLSTLKTCVVQENKNKN